MSNQRQLLFETVADTPDDLSFLASQLAAQLRPGDAIILNGPLGAGKTTFTQYLGRALGITERITSPTFTLARVYELDDNTPIFIHVDAYRLGGAAEFEDLGLPFEQAVSVVEWGSGLLEGLVDSWLEIDISREQQESDAGEPSAFFDDELIEPRTLRFYGSGQRWREGLAFVARD